MFKMELKKDGKGNIIITEDSFEMLLGCLDNQKFIGEAPQNGDSLAEGEENYTNTQKGIQNIIDKYNRECRDILHQHIIVEAVNDNYWLTHRYEKQEELIEWDKYMEPIFKLFENTEIKYSQERLDGLDNMVKRINESLKDEYQIAGFEEPKPTPWLIERALFQGYEYLTISENGRNNRPWKQEEIEQIQQIINN
jgi:hypothetical protein